MRHYEPIIVINEAAIHHICVTARKSGPGVSGLGGSELRQDPINVVLMEKPQKKGVLRIIMKEL